MNIIKAQKDIFKHLLNGSNAGKFAFDENNVFITPNGFYGFVLPKVSLQINADKIKEMVRLNIDEAVKEENRFDLTDECKILTRPYKVYAVKLKRDERELFINEKFLQYYQSPKFYSANPGLVVITEPTARDEEKIVGVVCPIRP